MSVQDVYSDHKGSRPAPYAWGGQYNVTAPSPIRVLQWSNGDLAFATGCVSYGSTSPGQELAYYVYSGETAIVAAEEYDPAFVDRVIKADAAPNEATVNNVVDLMEWLERD